jgi:hypothetical protein
VEELDTENKKNIEEFNRSGSGSSSSFDSEVHFKEWVDFKSEEQSTQPMMKIKKQQIVYKTPPPKVICSPKKTIYYPDNAYNSPDNVILHQKQTLVPFCNTPIIKNMTKYMQRRIKNYPDQTNHIRLNDKTKYSDYKSSVYSFKYQTPLQSPVEYTETESILNGKFVFVDMHIINFIFRYKPGINSCNI